jgi:alpha-beta hydrolase superfamily lysophospholipase
MPSAYLAHETWTTTDHHVVHAYLTDPLGDPSPPDAPVVVMVPGLGLPQYVFPTAKALSRQGVICAVLDVPGFAVPGRHGSRPDVAGIGRATAEWVEAHTLLGPLVVLGHSTGAQGALDAALRLQDTQPGLGFVMAGPTFTPRQRRFPRMAAAAATAYLRDSPGALIVVPTGLRRVSGVLAVVRSGMRDTPEERLRKLRVPLTLTAGKADTFAPKEWLQQLASAAVGSPRVTVRTLPGSHNNPYTYADEVAAVVLEAVTRVANAA